VSRGVKTTRILSDFSAAWSTLFAARAYAEGAAPPVCGTTAWGLDAAAACVLR
jgi:hypothetical protein